jgi:serine/threonine protein kinase
MSLSVHELTMAYASPESLNGDPPVFKSDVWSLGCLFYFMVT